MPKGSEHLIIVEGFIDRNIVITKNHIWVWWENEEVHYEANEVNEHYHPGEHWFYPIDGTVPSYSPAGIYKVKFQVNGYYVDDGDLEVIDVDPYIDDNDSLDLENLKETTQTISSDDIRS